jgi:hypothetical protein
MLQISTNVERKPRRQLRPSKTADSFNGRPTDLKPAIVKCLDRATEAFKAGEAQDVLARKSKHIAMGFSYKAASVMSNDKHWKKFRTAYQARFGVVLKDRDRRRPMFYSLIYAMGKNSEEARKEASRYAVEAQSYLDKRLSEHDFYRDLRSKGGITGLRRLRKSQRNDYVKTGAKKRPDRLLNTVKPSVEATLTGDVSSLLRMITGRRFTLQGTLKGVGKSVTIEIDQVAQL